MSEMSRDKRVRRFARQRENRRIFVGRRVPCAGRHYVTSKLISPTTVNEVEMVNSKTEDGSPAELTLGFRFSIVFFGA